MYGHYSFYHFYWLIWKWKGKANAERLWVTSCKGPYPSLKLSGSALGVTMSSPSSIKNIIKLTISFTFKSGSPWWHLSQTLIFIRDAGTMPTWANSQTAFTKYIFHISLPDIQDILDIIGESGQHMKRLFLFIFYSHEQLMISTLSLRQQLMIIQRLGVSTFSWKKTPIQSCGCHAIHSPHDPHIWFWLSSLLFWLLMKILARRYQNWVEHHFFSFFLHNFSWYSFHECHWHDQHHDHHLHGELDQMDGYDSGAEVAEGGHGSDLIS